MIIFMVGLGLIGASYAEGLSKCGHVVYATNRTPSVIESAKQEGIIHLESDISKMSDADVVILSLYPKHNVEFVKNHRHLFRKGQLVTDVSGTKTDMMRAIEALLPEGVLYTSTHPMAGKEISGYTAKDHKIFKKANYIIVKGNRSGIHDEEILRSIAKDLGFGHVIVTDAKTHDELIGFTSQLTHVLAVALMHADSFKMTKEATGDSFRDLTRIAKINEVMWSELFLENKEALLRQIEHFKQELDHIANMIQEDETESLQTYLRKAKEKRKTFDVH